MTTKQRVEAIMQYLPETRSNDKMLCIVFMQKAGLDLTDAQIKKFYEMDDLWTIRRCRQKIQEEGRFPATHAVNEARYKKFKQFRQTIPYNDSPLNIPSHW